MFGVAHVGTLITLRWDEGRAKVQRECIQKNWSKSALQAAIARRRERARADGCGRRPSIPADPELARVRLRQLARALERWFEAAEAKGLLHELPPQVDAARGAVAKLRWALDESRPTAADRAPAARQGEAPRRAGAGGMARRKR